MHGNMERLAAGGGNGLAVGYLIKSPAVFCPHLLDSIAFRHHTVGQPEINPCTFYLIIQRLMVVAIIAVCRCRFCRHFKIQLEKFAGFHGFIFTFRSAAICPHNVWRNRHNRILQFISQNLISIKLFCIIQRSCASCLSGQIGNAVAGAYDGVADFSVAAKGAKERKQGNAAVGFNHIDGIHFLRSKGIFSFCRWNSRPTPAV